MSTKKKLLQAAAGVGGGEPSDEFFNQTTLLLQGDGTDGGQNSTFLDDGPDALDPTSGNLPVQGNFSPFGDRWSAYFDGNGDYLSAASDTSFDCGTGNFTIEAWVYIRSENNAYPIICGNANPSYTTAGSLAFGNHNTDNASYNNKFIITARDNNNFRFADSTTHPLNTWIHIAVVRDSSTTLKMFRDGVETASTTIPSTMTFNWGLNGFRVGGGNWDGANRSEIDGYISNLRLVKGTAVYTSNFTPPTEPLTAISGTSVLTCQSNRFKDNSSNNFTLTPNGTPSVTKFSPYAPSEAYQPPVAPDISAVAFDGSGDYLTAADNAAFAFGTGAFTVEFWYYAQASLTNAGILDTRETGPSNNGLLIRQGDASSSGTTIDCYLGNPGSFSPARNTNLVLNAWNHIAAVRDGSNNVELYINGVAGTSVSSTVNLTDDKFRLGAFVNATASPNAANGFISNLRIVKGTAVYTSAFTPPTSPLTAISGTSLLTCQDGFVDNSTNNFTITTNGNPQLTEFGPFGDGDGYWSNVLDGTDDYIAAATSQEFEYGTGDFTIEFWVNVTAHKDFTIYFDSRTTNSQAIPYLYSGSNGILGYYINGSNRITASSALPTNQWVHVAVCRSGTSTKLFMDGVQTGSTWTDTTNYVQGGQLRVGNHFSTTSYGVNGGISNFRIVKGTALYTANFTPPTTPLTAVTGTSLLTCQSNRFVDNSSNAFALTVNGDPEVRQDNPFYVSIPDEVGSVYFNGNNQHLVTLNDTSAGSFGTGDFTVEYWFNCGAQATSYLTQVGTLDGSTPANSWRFGTQLGTSSGVFFSYHNGSSFVDTTFSSTNYNDNAWHHAAVSRSSGTLRAFIDGVQVGSNQTVTQNFTGRRINVGVESFTPSAYKGYLSNLRLVKGSAIYTSNFTPPTQPVGAVPNTSFLLNFDNANIYDSTGMNDLETVGNAQIDTSVVKYGTGSLKFDGTGDYLTAKAPSTLDFGSGDFTVEFWLNLNSLPSAYTRVLAISKSGVAASADEGFVFEINNTNKMTAVLINSSTTYPAIDTTNVATGTWEHWAAVRNGSTLTLYRDGTSVATATPGTNAMNFDSSTYILQIGYWAKNTGPERYLNGYLDDIRITKGVARYTSNFTPPTEALPNQ